MRFASFLLALPLAVLATPAAMPEAGLEKRTFQSVRTGLQTVNTDVNNLNKKLNEIPDDQAPTNAQTLALLNLSNKLKADLNSVDDDVDNDAKYSAANSKTLFDYLNGTLLTSTRRVLQNFIDHYPGISKSGTQNIVRDQLAQQKAIVDDLSKSLVAKSQGLTAAQTNGLIAKYNKAFQAAIDRYAA